MTHTLLTAFVVMMCALAPSDVEGMPASAQTAGYAGRSLTDVLRDLQSRGLKVVFSSELVRPDMRVVSEPKSTHPSRILAEVLAPHGLRAAEGPTGTWFIVRARKAASASASSTLKTRPISTQAPAPVPVSKPVAAGVGSYVESVTVSARGREEAPAPSRIVLAPAAVQRVAGTGDNIFRVLQTLPGVSPTDDFSSRIAVRGGSPDQNLTVMDGVEIHNPYRLFGIASAFNPEITDRFELSAGGFGAQYGDRLSSILVVDNRQGTPAKAIAGSATASFTDANVVLEGRLPWHANGSWLVTGRRTYYDLVADRLTKHDDFPGFQDVQAKGVWDPKPGHRLTLFALRSRERADVTGKDDRIPEENLTTAARWTTRNDVAAVSYSAPLGARLSSRTVAAWSQYRDALDVHGSEMDETRRSNARRPDDIGDVRGIWVVALTRDLDVRDVSIRQEISIPAGTRHLFETGFDVHAFRTGWGWTIGDDMTRDAANGSANGSSDLSDTVGFGVGLPSLLRSARDTTRAALWFQDRYQPRAGVRLEPGLRIDRSGLSGETVVSPRLGIRMDLTPRTRVRGAIGRYTQSPGYEKILQSNYFVDLTSADSRHLSSERSLHVIGAVEHALTSSVTARIEAYSKTFDRLIVGRLETPAETAARIAPYDFPAAIASSVPSAPIITANPVNSATGHAYGLDVYIEKPPHARRDRVSGWASYAWGVANITSYGRQYPADYDRRHAASLVGTVWLSRRLDLGATLRLASGFPATPATGIRVAPTPTADGRLVPARDSTGLYVWSVDMGGAANLNTARLPHYARLDVRVTFNPKKVTGRWQIYAELLNALYHENISGVSYELQYEPASDRPRLVSTDRHSGFPLLPSFGVRYRF